MLTQREAHSGTTSTIESSLMNWSAFALSSTRERAARARNDSHCDLLRNIGEWLLHFIMGALRSNLPSDSGAGAIIINHPARASIAH